MQHKGYREPEDSQPGGAGAVRREILPKLLELLAEFALHAGLSAGELNIMFRAAAIRSVAAKQLEAANRINVSGIAATTGVPRAEVTQVLKASTATIEAGRNHPDARQSPIARTLAAWINDPMFCGQRGQAPDLKIYGSGHTFETLAKKYARGIPVRALLDELVRSGNIELLETNSGPEMVRIAKDRGKNVRAVKSFEEESAELISSMLRNVRKPGLRIIRANASSMSTIFGVLKLLQKDLSKKDFDFVLKFQERLFGGSGAGRRKKRGKVAMRVNATFYYQEHVDTSGTESIAQRKRRNLKRAG
jgi:hypothetical protein